MKIFFDYQAFGQQYGGVSRYFCELITGINSKEQHHAHLSLLWSNNIHLREHGFSVRPYPFPKRHRLFDKTNRLYNLIDCKTSKYDIYHATYFDDFLVSYNSSIPFVMTFHDMIYERLSHQFTDLSTDKWIVSQKRKVAQKAPHLIAVSQNTKQDMVELLGVLPEKITVIHLNSPFIFDSSVTVSPPHLLDRPYILYVGKRDNYKNFVPFLRAIANVLIRHQVDLICAGGGDFSINEQYLIKELHLKKYVKYKAINDLILQDLYKGAISLVFPSLYEGFGIPVLEAFSCNCPCIVSNVSSLPEIAGPAAAYIDPYSSESMSSVVESVILDSNIKKDLIQLGQQQLSNFSQQQTVNKTLSLYEKLI